MELVWGSGINRKTRIGINASSKPIDEAFADFWTASLLAPDLLTPDERRYFDNIHTGLRDYPKEFVEAIAHGDIQL